METFQINIRSEFVPLLQNIAAREGSSIEAVIELLLEEKLSEINRQ